MLQLGGALQVPCETLPTRRPGGGRRKYERWDEPFPHPFQTALAALVNLADDYAQQPGRTRTRRAGPRRDDPDPLVTPPLYGRWHALTQRLLRRRATARRSPDDDNWVHELNLDPRLPGAGGLGTAVVQANDEEYMDAAWQQVGDVLEANARIRRAQLAQAATLRLARAALRRCSPADPSARSCSTAPVAPARDRRRA